MVLNSRQRGILSRLAATMQPIVMVGKEGASAGVEQALRNEFKNRELIKIRFIANKEERAELAEDLARRLGATLVRIIGHVAILYRPADDPRERHIHLSE